MLVDWRLAKLFAEIEEDVGSRDLDKGVILSLEEDNIVLVNVLEKEVSEQDVDLLPLSGNELRLVQVNVQRLQSFAIVSVLVGVSFVVYVAIGLQVLGFTLVDKLFDHLV